MAADYRQVMERASAYFAEFNRYPAGQQYCDALLKLGLDPDLMCWAYLSSENRMELAVVTSMVDRVGPLPIYELLFKAYDMSALPKEIDPFEVSLYSPNTQIGIDLLNNINIPPGGKFGHRPDGKEITIDGAWFSVGYSDPMIVHGRGIYCVNTKIRNADQDRAVWAVFKKNVEELAA